MSHPTHHHILIDALERDDIALWNTWRIEHPNIAPDLTRADLTAADLGDADLRDADLRDANLTRADLTEANLNRADLTDADLIDAYLTRADLILADLTRADLSDANLSAANLYRADLTGARLTGARLTSADLTEADLTAANLTNAYLNAADLTDTHLNASNLTNAYFGNTKIVNIDLSTVRGLETIRHEAPSDISISTLYKSGGNIPEIFLRGCGVPETMITFAKSLVNSAIEYYSAFISYSSHDEHFARRLHNDLQANGVRVWFAPEDLKPGDYIKQSIDESIRLYDKLILVLSENSINSAWVRHEFAGAVNKEKQHNKLVLFPLRLDDTIFTTTEQWAYDIRQRHIADFTKWENPIVYQGVMNRLLRDLNAKS